MKRNISEGVLRRIGTYLSYLKTLPGDHNEHLSAGSIAAAMDLREITVRKDLAATTYPGTQKNGRRCVDVIRSLEEYLGMERRKKAVYIGAGELLPWIRRSCGDYLDIMARFTSNARANGSILSLSKLRGYCRAHEIELVIIDVAAHDIPKILLVLENSGIRMIWNFSSAPIRKMEGITVRNEDILSSLAVLSFSDEANHSLTI